MRSKSTNVLQTGVLITGLLFIIIGIFFFISPLTVLSFFAENVSENWLDLVKDNELVAPLYYYSQGMSSLLFVAGFSMIMPLFDPLKYRGMIYFNGILFPFFSAIVFMKNGISYLLNDRVPPAATKSPSIISNNGGHLILLILGCVFILIFILNFIGLFITRPDAQKGVE